MVTRECCYAFLAIFAAVVTSFGVGDEYQTVMPETRAFGVLCDFTNPFVYLEDNEFICENREG